MILDVISYPNPLLRKKSKPVSLFDEKLHTLLDNMYETMIEKRGVGIAAIQVGIPIRALIINLFREEEEFQNKEDLIEIINPEFLSKSGEVLWKEGCLSVPGFYDEVKRFSDVAVRYQDRFGEFHEISTDGLLAIALQHENDHLDGILFVDRLSILKRKKFEKELKNHLNGNKENIKSEV